MSTITTTTTTTPCPRRRGTLIALEGLDRAGKSTQCTLLQAKLTSLSLLHRLQKFPDRTTPTGSIIHSYLTTATSLESHAIHLLFTSNRWEAAPSLLRSLEEGETVIMDRYLYSGIAFSAAKGLEYEFCKAPERGLPRPDVVVFLDLPEDVAERREGFGGERYEAKEFQRIVRGYFQRLREEEEMVGEGGKGTRWRVVDASRSVQEVAEEVWSAVEEAMRFAEGNEVGVWR